MNWSVITILLWHLWVCYNYIVFHSVNECLYSKLRSEVIFRCCRISQSNRPVHIAFKVCRLSQDILLYLLIAHDRCHADAGFCILVLEFRSIQCMFWLSSGTFRNSSVTNPWRQQRLFLPLTTGLHKQLLQTICVPIKNCGLGIYRSHYK